MPVPRNINKRYKWIPSLPDHRDFTYEAPRFAVSLPNIVDMRSDMPALYDQGKLGSCTANSSGAMVQYYLMKQGKTWVPSRLFIYYNERVLMKTVGQDSGGTNRDVMKSLSKYGVCSEQIWPYNINKFRQKPPQQCYTAALKTKIGAYHSVDNTKVNDVKSCLAQGQPVVAGYSVYESFESSAVEMTGIVPMPQKGESLLGGHSVLVVGYEDANAWYIVRNSWGDDWGDGGYFYMPYDYFSNRKLATDFWTASGLVLKTQQA